jgi:hypothetical protein
MVETRFGTFDELLAESGPNVAPIVARLRAIVLATHPQAVEVVRLGDRAVTFGLGPKKMSEGYCYVMPQRQWVNLGFYEGARLPDPEGLLEGTGARLRHVKVRSLEATERPALAALIEAALAERRSALGG